MHTIEIDKMLCILIIPVYLRVFIFIVLKGGFIHLINGKKLILFLNESSYK